MTRLRLDRTVHYTCLVLQLDFSTYDWSKDSKIDMFRIYFLLINPLKNSSELLLSLSLDWESGVRDLFVMFDDDAEPRSVLDIAGFAVALAGVCPVLAALEAVEVLAGVDLCAVLAGLLAFLVGLCALLGAAVVGLEAAVVGLEAAVVGLEAAVVGLEAAVVGLEAAVVGLEAAVVGLEAAVVGLEAAVVGLEAAVVGLEAVSLEEMFF